MVFPAGAVHNVKKAKNHAAHHEYSALDILCESLDWS